MGINMKVVSNLAAAAFSIAAFILTPPSQAAEILGGGGNAADKLMLDWANAKSGKSNPLKFSNSILSNDLAMVQTGRIDFAIVDSPVNEAELNRLNLVQYPFTLSGISVMVNLQNTLAGPLKLDGATLGKIFSGEITSWDDAAITSLNPKHDLPSKPIVIVHSGEGSTDFPVISAYLAAVNEKWRAGELNKKHDWPTNAIQTDSLASRISAIKSTPFSISFLPMQYLPLPTISTVLMKNRDGNFVALSDTSIIASTAGSNIDETRPATMSLVNKGGAASWPLSYFTFIVTSKDRLKDEAVAQILNIVHHGLKFGSLKPTVHNFVQLPDNIAKTVMSKIEPFTVVSNAGGGKNATAKASQEAQEMANKRRIEEENRQRADAKNTAPQDDKSKADERNRLAKQQADEQAREQAIKEARAAKQAAEEAIKAANAAKLEAEKLAEKNRQIAKAEKEKADREQAERDRVERERAEKEKAIQLRNQKDEDPLEAYRRTGK